MVHGGLVLLVQLCENDEATVVLGVVQGGLVFLVQLCAVCQSRRAGLQHEHAQGNQPAHTTSPIFLRYEDDF
jgi:hypothetical protein